MAITPRELDSMLKEFRDSSMALGSRYTGRRSVDIYEPVTPSLDTEFAKSNLNWFISYMSTSSRRTVCEAFNKAGITPLKVLGVGQNRIVFDIGNQRVACLGPPQRDPGISDLLRPSSVHALGELREKLLVRLLKEPRRKFVIEIMDKAKLASQAEADFLAWRAERRDRKRGGDMKAANVGRVEKDGSLKVLDPDMFEDLPDGSDHRGVYLYELRDPDRPRNELSRVVAEISDGAKSSWMEWERASMTWKPAPEMKRFHESPQWREKAVLRPVGDFELALPQSSTAAMDMSI